MHNEPGYTIERFSSAHIPALETLYAAVYGRAPAPGYFASKYDTAYTGRSYIGYLAFCNGNVAGYYGVIPCYLLYNGQQVLAAQSADTMTHPGYRLKGLFVTLSEETFRLCRENDIRVLFGFPNQHSLHGAIHKLNWKLAHTMEVFSIPAASLPLARWHQSTGTAGRWYREYRRSVVSRYTTSLQGIHPAEKEGRVVRTTEYLRHKSRSGQMVWQIGAATVWLKLSSVMTIGDMDVQEEEFETVMRVLQRLAGRLGITRILFQASAGTTLHRLFAARYPAQPSFPVLFQQLDSSIDITRFRFVFADIDIF